MSTTAPPSAEEDAVPAASPSDPAAMLPAGVRRALLRGGVLQAAAALCWLPQAGLLAWAVQIIADGGGVAALVTPAILIVLVGLARAAVEAWGGRRVFAAARGALADLRSDALDRLLARSSVDATRPLAGHAASVLGEQADSVLASLIRFDPVRLRAAVVPVAILLAVVPLSWVPALALLLAASVIPVFMALIGWRAQAASEEQMLELGGMNGFLLDRLRGLATIRGLGAVDATADRLSFQAETLRVRSMAVLRIAFLSSTVLELFSALGVAMVATFIGFHLLGMLNFGTWGDRLSLGEGLFILLLAPAFFEPLRELAAAWHDRAAGRAAMAALQALSPSGGAGAEVPASEVEPVPSSPAVALADVVFRYPGADRPVLDGLSLTLRPGEHVALMAPSGRGKSTVLALIGGLAAPDAGAIRIGGIPMRPGTAQGLRHRIAWLGPNPFIQAGTLRANVLFGRPGLTPAMADRMLSLVGLTDPGRTVGEAGAGLSGGEAARLVLARALVDPLATLVLADEPTAHLDPDTAAAVTEVLLTQCEGRTLLLATHDPALAGRLDRIVTL